MNTDLNTFDSQERLIKSSLSRIAVDTSNITANVLEAVSEQKQRSTRRVRRGLTLVAAIVAVMAITTTALAATGGFDWIMQRINPTFSEVIEPVMIYTEDQGIRMTVIGAQTFDNRAVVYISLQDVSGENRIARHGGIGMGLFFHDAIDEVYPSDIFYEDSAIMAPLFVGGTSVRMIYFDEAANTAYFELAMTVTDGSISNSLIINNTCVEFDRVFIDAEPAGISLANLEAPNILDATLGYYVNSSRGWDEHSLFGSTIEMLEPGRFAELPNYTDNHWVSNIGVIDGNLHVQTIGHSDGSRFGGSGVSFELLRADGEVIHFSDMIFATADENFNLTSTSGIFDGNGKMLHVTEFIFDVDVENLSDYTLVFYGSISSGIEGDWTIQVDTSDTSTQIITIIEEHYVTGHTVEFITVNPIGIQVRGSFPAYWTMDAHELLTAYIETTDGIVELRQSGGFYSEAREAPEATGGVFTINFDAESLIYVESVTAVVINGVRIEIS